MEAISIKQKEIVIIDNDNHAGNGGGGDGENDFKEEKKEEAGIVTEIEESGIVIDGSDSSSLSVPKPLEGLNETGPPPFLRKTFEMLEDSSTDSIISWSPNRNSFIVWDSHQFSTNLLPKHFKHSNFASFIRQLNTYGFRKVDSDRWEFAHEGFQGGKKYLLKNIKRRSKPSQNFVTQMARRSTLDDDSVKLRLEVEIEKLRDDQSTLHLELLKLKEQQESTENHLASVKQRIQYTEHKQQQMVMFMARAFNPNFLRQLISQLRQKRALGCGKTYKKRRLMGSLEPEHPVEAVITAPQSTEGCKVQNQEEMGTVEADIQTLLSPSVNDEHSWTANEDQKGDGDKGDSDPGSSAESFIMWEKLLEDDMIFEDEAAVGDFGENQSKIVLELEDLVLKPPNKGGHVKELREQVVYLESMT